MGCFWYFEWDRSEAIFGNFSENVVQGSVIQGETRQEHIYIFVLFLRLLPSAVPLSKKLKK